jgi:hypothetical protein
LVLSRLQGGIQGRIFRSVNRIQLIGDRFRAIGAYIFRYCIGIQPAAGFTLPAGKVLGILKNVVGYGDFRKVMALAMA